MQYPTPFLVFARSSHAFGHLAEPRDIELIASTHEKLLLMGRNTLVCPLIADVDDDNLERRVFGDRGRPRWLDFCEVLEIGHDVAAAPEGPPRPVGLPEWRPSRYVQAHLDSIIGEPSGLSFGRRMLLISIDGDVAEREGERARQRVEQALGDGARRVWHGETSLRVLLYRTRQVCPHRQEASSRPRQPRCPRLPAGGGRGARAARPQRRLSPPAVARCGDSRVAGLLLMPRATSPAGPGHPQRAAPAGSAGAAHHVAGRSHHRNAYGLPAWGSRRGRAPRRRTAAKLHWLSRWFCWRPRRDSNARPPD